jgi:hypothetical protein
MVIDGPGAPAGADVVADEHLEATTVDHGDRVISLTSVDNHHLRALPNVAAFRT